MMKMPVKMRLPRYRSEIDMNLKYHSSAEIKRQKTKAYFDSTNEWTSIKELAEYLGCSMQSAKYYVERLIDRGYLELKSIKVRGSDGILRPANHYRKTNKSV